jgi:uncharacterized protein (TIRG00374 family)
LKGRLLAGVLLGAFFLFLSLRQVDFGVIAENLRRAEYGYFIPFTAVILATLWFRALRWGYLLRPIQAVPARRLLSPLCIGLMGNFIFPARAGEFIRAYLLGRREGISKSAAFATVVVERLFDGLAIISFLGLAPFFLGETDGAAIAKFKWIGIAVLLIYLALLVSLFVLSHHREVVSRYLIDSPPARRWKIVRRFFEIVQKFTEGLAVLKSTGDIVVSLALSFLIWGLAGTANYLMMLSVDLTLPLYAAFFLVVLQSFGVMVPSPGFVGSYQYAHIVALGVYGVSESVAFSLAILLHAGFFIIITALGLFFLAREHLGWRDLEEASTEDQG